MTYQTPELLLVGAAQNLVLGTQDKVPGSWNHDLGNPFYDAEGILDSGNW